MAHTADVLVVGAGPTGLALGALLARQDVEVSVIDGAAGPLRESSRATTVHAATLEQLDRLDGAGAEMAAAGRQASTSSLWAGTRRVARVHWDRIPSRYSFMTNLAQADTEAILRSRLANAGGRVRWGHRLADLHDADDAVVAHVDGPDGPLEVQARFVVGCDGAHSMVRRAAGISLDGTTHEERFLLADVDLDCDLDRDQTHVFVSTAGMIGIMPMPDGGFRLNGTVTDDEDLTPDTLPSLVARRTGRSTVTVSRVDWVSDYRTHSRIADRYRAGAVFLVGDAAHLNSPVGGQGMNLGIQDAVNLGWKLAAVLRRHADEALLDTYEQERRPVAAGVLQSAETSTRMITARHPVERRVRNVLMWLVHRLPPVQQMLAVEPSGVLQRYEQGALAPDTADLVGRRLPDIIVESKTATRFHDLVDHDVAHHVLLLDPDHQLATSWDHWAQDRAVAVHHLPAGDELRHAVPLEHSSAMLIRPDGFVAWSGTNPEDLDPASLGLAPRAHSTNPGGEPL